MSIIAAFISAAATVGAALMSGGGSGSSQTGVPGSSGALLGGLGQMQGGASGMSQGAAMPPNYEQNRVAQMMGSGQFAPFRLGQAAPPQKQMGQLPLPY